MNDEKEINDFIAATNEAIDSKFIVAEKKISGVLRAVAASDRLIELFKTVTYGFDFKAAMAKACEKIGSRGKLVMPSSPAAFLAFAFYLLLDIDNGKRSLRELLDDYYRAPSPNEQYSLFAGAVLVPFRDATEYVYYNGVDGTNANPAVNEAALGLLRELNSTINRSEAVASSKRELYALTQGLEAAVLDCRSEYVKPLLIGLKATLNATAGLPDSAAATFSSLLGALS